MHVAGIWMDKWTERQDLYMCITGYYRKPSILLIPMKIELL